MIDPVAFRIFGIDIRWYGILMASGILIGMVLALREAKRQGIEENTMLDLFLVAIPSAIVGARAYYVIFNWSYYSGDFLKMINTRLGGMAIHGGVIGGVLAGYIFCRVKKLSFPKLVDITAPSLILGQAIGRWGNFINQEAHGGPTDLPWGIMVDGMKVHPTFLYESIWNLGVFALLLFMRRKKRYEGQVMVVYMMAYSLGRFWIEGLRTDSLMLGPLRMAQVISIVLIGIAIIINMIMTKKNTNAA
ncbi:phosphatidylglycerol:prolipoprotein diacylglycerol transferase [Peptoclostridium litorale DSM 5388]|uniref:Phosphatidylglycerol--prolipoprotein diacylglyceryl transferase n=1 Tax=Peptoclostridium litorale DSM 5388 TaxID=1121324 RepID=A0A069RE41_PEPLI|nr:prolipoprotein diacylglyceryl transferase [Peptoclostridium litorale]KDR95013.1 prolipoprotein diacylglyceryl transferase Lgt [Peptoclostridium litorale DSM 5388]SIN76537.1 phosphatidylglycerol:prolipoprotein diacylglycerol transferase [Peptoclostridium litorale DSM 5388]